MFACLPRQTVEPRPPKGFPPFPPLRMALPDTIIVDYDAAVGARPHAPRRTPLVVALKIPF